MPDLDFLSQLLGPQQPLPGPPQDATPAPDSPSLSPTAQTILQQSVQTPQDLMDEYRRRYFGLDPNDKKAEPTTKQRLKKGALEVLRGLLDPNYVNAPDRIKADALKAYQLQTPRLNVAAPLERVMSQLQMAQDRISQQEKALQEKAREANNRNDRAVDRNANFLSGVQSRGQLGNDRLSLMAQQLGLQAPLIKARTGLINQQAQNAQTTQGLGGQFGFANQMMNRDNGLDEGGALRIIRDNSKFPPGSGNGGGGADRIFPQATTTLSPDTGETQTSTNYIGINPRTHAVTDITNRAQPAGALTPKDVEKVNDFGSAATMARQLANSIAESVKSGKAENFMGLLQGNSLSSAARASGLFGTSKDFNESLFQILKANGLFQHISSFAGKRITNRELDYMNKYLGRQTDSPESALSAAVAASQLLEVAKLQKGKLLSEDFNPTPLMRAEHARFMKELGYSQDANGNFTKTGPASANPTLRSMRDVLNQNGVLKRNDSSGTSGSETPKPAGPGIDSALLDEINKRLKKK